MLLFPAIASTSTTTSIETYCPLATAVTSGRDLNQLHVPRIGFGFGECAAIDAETSSRRRSGTNDATAFGSSAVL